MVLNALIRPGEVCLTVVPVAPARISSRYCCSQNKSVEEKLINSIRIRITILLESLVVQKSMAAWRRRNERRISKCI